MRVEKKMGHRQSGRPPEGLGRARQVPPPFSHSFFLLEAQKQCLEMQQPFCDCEAITWGMKANINDSKTERGKERLFPDGMAGPLPQPCEAT
ncbi:hypothetical protein H8959_006884 [Pygathrix nigripes]